MFTFMFPQFSRSFSCTVWGLFLAYFLFLLVEAPLGRLEKMVLLRRMQRSNNNEKQLSDVENGEKSQCASTFIISHNSLGLETFSKNVKLSYTSLMNTTVVAQPNWVANSHS